MYMVETDKNMELGLINAVGINNLPYELGY